MFMDPHDVAPMVGMVVIFMIPIVGILTRHQQKMALIMRQTHLETQGQPSREAQELRQMIRDQSIAIEQMRSEVRQMNSAMSNSRADDSMTSTLRERL